MSIAPSAPYGMLAEFDSADALIAAVKRVKDAGYDAVEAYSPYPLPEAAEALGYRKGGTAAIALSGGLIGGLAAFFLQYYIAAIDYPINIGGRPTNSWPVFIPITFELTVLTSSLAIFLGTLILCGLPRFHHALFNSEAFQRATTDRYFLCIEAADPKYHSTETRTFLLMLEPVGVEEVFT